MKQAHCFITLFQLLNWDNKAHLNMEIFGEDTLGVDDIKTILDTLKQNQLGDLFSFEC